MEFYLARKMNELLTQQTTWMNLRNIFLSEKRQTQRSLDHIIPFTSSSRITKTIWHNSGQNSGYLCGKGSLDWKIRNLWVWYVRNVLRFYLGVVTWANDT